METRKIWIIKEARKKLRALKSITTSLFRGYILRIDGNCVICDLRTRKPNFGVCILLRTRERFSAHIENNAEVTGAESVVCEKHLAVLRKRGEKMISDTKNKVRAGIICALTNEAKTLIDEMTEKRSQTLLGREYTCGLLCGKPVCVAVAGVGKVAAAACAQTMLLCFEPDFVINTGIGGTLVPEVTVLDTVVATDVVEYDYDTTLCGGECEGFIDAIGEVHIKCDEKLSDLLARCTEKAGQRTLRGTVATGDTFIGDEEKKKNARRISGGIVCEMEGGAIGQVCRMANVPFCVVRTVSDTGGEGEYLKFIKEASKRSALAVTEFIKNV